jgi:hypothetical protein
MSPDDRVQNVQGVQAVQGRANPQSPALSQSAALTDAQLGDAAALPRAGAGDVDLFTLGRRAAAAARTRHEGRGVFARSRQLLATTAWKGPRDAAESYVEEADLAALGGLPAARDAGARTLVATTPAAAREAAASNMRVVFRLPYRAGEAEAARSSRLLQLQDLLAEGIAIDGVLPTPEGEPMGLDTLRIYVTCRLELEVPHVLADFDRLGHRLAQMALGFGADELFGPILPERALRLGNNAHNPVLTRKEAAILLRGAGLVPCERLGAGGLEEIPS